MKRLDLYIIKKYFTTFFLAIVLLLVVVIVFDFSEKIDKFLVDTITMREIIFDYYANFIPYFFNLFLYLFVFIAVIFFTSKLAQNSEIIAILSSGVSFYRLLVPYLTCAFLLTILAFFMSNFIIPKTNIKLTDFENKYLRKSAKYAMYVNDIHVQIGKADYVYVKSYNGRDNAGNDFTYEKIDFDEGMTYKLAARKVRWNEGDSTWTVMNYTERNIYSDREQVVSGDMKTIKINLMPKDFVFVVYDLKVMNFHQLNKFIEEERIKGVRNIVEFEVEKHCRIANSFATIILTVLGFSLSCRKKRAGMGLNLGFGIALTFTYIFLMQLTTTFAINSNLAPWLAAWIPNIVFAGIACVIMLKAPK
ncbi:MAG: LptF/LptG family permease [Bacteroidales bacterium]|nr:LptF/LptG family permease [Bacteroidales bacterium]